MEPVKMKPLILVANPGSSSRKYGLYRGDEPIVRLHFEMEKDKVVCHINSSGDSRKHQLDLESVKDASSRLTGILHKQEFLKAGEKLDAIALRVVAPGSYFLSDKLIDEKFIDALNNSRQNAPLHVDATLAEYQKIVDQFPETKIYGISDSSFHITKAEYAWNYGIKIEDADRLDIKRFGYHGISLSSAVSVLKSNHRLAPKTIVCHIGSGVSVTALHDGKSLDTSMGYSPLEGSLMATRSGSIDVAAARVLKKSLDLDDEGLESYLNHSGGLQGLAGNSDVRELLEREKSGDNIAHLALETYVHSIQKYIGQMAAALGGADMLVFTGTVGERSVQIRHRIVEHLHYLDFRLDEHHNSLCNDPDQLTRLGTLAHSKPIFVAPADEAGEMARRTRALLRS